MAMTPSYPGADAADPTPPVNDQSAMAGQSGFEVCIRVDGQGGLSVGVEKDGQEAAEGAEGAGEDDDSGYAPCKSRKEALTLALEILKADGVMPGRADDDFQSGFGQSGE